MSSPLPGKVRVTGYFIQGSPATGLLIATLTTSNTLYLNLIQRNSDQLQIVGTVEGVVGGRHYV